MGSEVLEQVGASAEPLLGLCDGDGAPDSWELADLEESMRELLASSSVVPEADGEVAFRDVPSKIASPVSVEFGASSSTETDEVDSFLKEALQSKDRLTILRLEQEVAKFIRNPRLQHLEFQPMPSSYLRLAAHRVAQHYNLQSSVVDSSAPEGVRIIARKTAESRIPRVRLADISAGTEPEDRQVEIKRRPFKGAKVIGEYDGSGDFSSRLNQHKSVEERKEEYNKARARIFSSSDLAGTVMEDETLFLESLQNVEVFPSGTVRLDKKLEEPSESVTRVELNDDLGKALNGKAERETGARNKGNSNRVAIFRDREKDRRDPDYDRSYDRYMQRFDPGFGVNLGPFGMQAMYTPVLNYNTEFPQLGAPTRPQMCVEPPLPRASQTLRGPWAGSSNSLGYGHLDPMIGHFNPGHLGQHSGAGVYVQLPQFTCPSPAVTYMHPQERLQQSVSQPHLQPTGSFSQARRH